MNSSSGLCACLLLFSTLPLACQNSGTSLDFERMVNQSSFRAYKECPFFPDRRELQDPPRGTKPLEGLQWPEALEKGVMGEKYVEKNPVLLTTVFVEMGRRRFVVFCAPCHGVQGNGLSVVAQKMTLRAPPSLMTDRIRQLPDGRIFVAITKGYGLMPKYDQEIDVVDRWAIVAYVRALELRATGIPLDRLPLSLRHRAEEALQ